jgi:hypothetical protein
MGKGKDTSSPSGEPSAETSKSSLNTPPSYPIEWEVSDILKIRKDAERNYVVLTARMGFSKKTKKPVITWDSGYTSSLKHALKMGLRTAFDSDIIKMLDKLDELEGKIDSIFATDSPNSVSKTRKGEK